MGKTCAPDQSLMLGGWMTGETQDQPGLLESGFGIGYDARGMRDSVETDFSVDGGTTTKHDYKNLYGWDAKGRMESLQQTSTSSGTNYSVVADKSFAFAY